jgi:PhnB protein
MADHLLFLNKGVSNMAVSHIPEGYHSVTPYLIVDGAAEAIRFYGRAFGASEVLRMPMSEDKLAHAEILIGDSHVMLADEVPDMGFLAPSKRGGATASLMIYVEDVDAAFARAIEAGATEERAPADQFWGDRMGTLLDPFGHRWTLATHIEDVSDDEMQRRAAAAFQ